MDVKIAPSWKAHLDAEFQQPYFQDLVSFVKSEYQQHKVYPPAKEIFRAFELCSLDATKVVILGQDPYHGPGQANGLCFSVREEVPTPPSLVNIFKEIKNDVGTPIPQHGNLERWARQGVLLLNATLTVRARKPGSHQNKGWETFTDAVIQTVARARKHLVFILWGAYAQKKATLIDNTQHLVLKSAHPSPYSADRGFFGSRHFSQADTYLKAHQQEEVVW